MATHCQPLTLLEAAKRTCDPIPNDDAWLQDIIKDHCGRLLRCSEQYNQDSIHQLLLPKDSVSLLLLQELLSRCAANADTPVGSTLGDERPLAWGNACGKAERSPISKYRPAAEPFPEPASVPELIAADPHLPADISGPHADAVGAGSFKMNVTSKKMLKLMKKGMKEFAEVCPQRSQHPDVDMGWRHCEICLAKFGMWTKWCVESQ
jgi:hypothetical protein